MKRINSDIWVGVAVLAVLGLLIHPYWMPMGFVVTAIAMLALLVFGFGIYVWRESPQDEREYQESAQAGRLAYLVGAGFLTVGVAVQTMHHSLDIWVVLALASMVLAKIASGLIKHKM